MGKWYKRSALTGGAALLAPPVTFRLMDGLAGRPGNGPATPSAFIGNYLAGVGFAVTSGGCWFTGYWWWVCNSGQQTGAQKFALWEITAAAANGVLIAGSVVTSGTLTAGAWNYVPLVTPLPLSINTFYQAATGFVSSTGFPELDNQFSAGQPYAAGITNGPLFAYGNNPTPAAVPNQGQFSSTAGADPSVNMPLSAFNNANFFMDCQVTTVPPVGTSYRLWPSQPQPINFAPDTPQANWTLGTEFTISRACTVNNIWFYSQSGATQLPTDTGIWAVPAGTLVAGTHNASPSWSGVAGSGWVSVAGGYTLPAGDYKVSVYNGGSIVNPWSAATFPYWDTNAGNSGPGVNGITTGPLHAPNNATATSPGQSTFQLGAGPSFAYPNTFASGVGASTYWVDVEVTPV